MFLPREESVDKKINPSLHSNQRPHSEVMVSSFSSSGKNQSDSKTKLDKGRLESDEDLFRVPDVAVVKNDANAEVHNIKAEVQAGGKRRRGRNPVDKEYRRLKRLLRNRVSAQQARERKKVYVNDLESKATELQDTNSRLEEKISTLINENAMLRKVLMNTRPKADDNARKD